VEFFGLGARCSAILQITWSAMITVMLLISEAPGEQSYTKVFSAVLSAAVATASGVNASCKFRERWLQYLGLRNRDDRQRPGEAHQQRKNQFHCFGSPPAYFMPEGQVMPTKPLQRAEGFGILVVAHFRLRCSRVSTALQCNALRGFRHWRRWNVCEFAIGETLVGRAIGPPQ